MYEKEMYLKEELELLYEKFSVAEILDYIKDIKKARIFDGCTF